jgi:hypothetical protein
MCGDLLDNFQLPTVLEKRGDAGRTERVVADLRFNTAAFARLRMLPNREAQGTLIVNL